MTMGTNRLDMQTWESIQMLRSHGVGRVCLLDHGHPIALPVNYRLIGSEGQHQLVVRTAPNSLIGQYEGAASIEVDHIDLDTRQAWSVLVRGTLRHVVGAHGLPDPEPWLLDDRHHWMVLDVTAITGRRFVGTPSTDGVTVDWELAGP
jgi:uncharacterized protein